MFAWAEKCVIGVVVAAAALLPQAAGDKPAPKGLKVGDEAPMRTAEMKDLDGKAVTFDSVAGKNGTLVIFSCVHCPMVKAYDERIAAVGNSCKAQEIGVVVINSNDPTAYPDDGIDGMKAQAKKFKYDFTYAIDATSDIARAYNARVTPEVFLFDAKHKLVYHGAIDDNSQSAAEVKKGWLRDAIAAVAAGKAPPVAETKAVGCGVKLRAKKDAVKQ